MDNQNIAPPAEPTGVRSITVEIRNVYGEDKVYPVCEKAYLFANIGGTITLTQRMIDSIKLMGVEILVLQKQLKRL